MVEGVLIHTRWMAFSLYQHSRVQHQVSPTHIQAVIVTTSEYLYGLFRLTVLIPTPRMSWTNSGPRPVCPSICPLYKCTNDVLYILLQTHHLCNAYRFPLIYCRNIMTFALTHSLTQPLRLFFSLFFIHIQSSSSLACDIHYDLHPVHLLVLCRKAFI